MITAESGIFGMKILRSFLNLQVCVIYHDSRAMMHFMPLPLVVKNELLFTSWDHIVVEDIFFECFIRWMQIYVVAKNL